MVYWIQFLLGEISMKKLENFWFYYKKHLLIGLAVLAVLGWLGFQRATTPEPDYHIGILRTVPLPEEQLAALKEPFTAAGEDLNGDGRVLVQLHTYYVDLAADSSNVSEDTVQTVAALDADLTGKVSGIFLVENEAAFQSVTGNLLEGPFAQFDFGLYIAIRGDASEAYRHLMDKII